MTAVTKCSFHPFSVRNWPINVRVGFEPWATLDCFKIITYLYAQNGEPAYSTRYLATVLDSSKSAIIRAIKLLTENQYIKKVGNCYFLNSSIEVDKSGSSDPSTGQATQESPKVTQVRHSSDPSTGHNSNKEITIKNNKTAHPTDEALDNSPDAPKHLLRKKDPLAQIVKNVWLTENELKKLFDKFGSESEIKFLCLELSKYSLKEPKKFAKYVDHYDVIQTWRRNRHKDGFFWGNHPRGGPGYYKETILNSLEG